MLFMSLAVLERRSELLKKRIQELIIKDNQYGISRQQNMFLQHMIKELHQTSYELNTERG